MPIDEGAEAAKFLERDFVECFAEKRHFDGQIWDICKFTFTAYTALIGVSVGLYKYSIDRQVDLIPAAIFALIVGVLFGLLMFWITIRNRVYFVIVTRYINEQRQLFFRFKPLGFENVSQLYTEPHHPPFFDWRSSQSMLSFVIAILNSLLLATLAFFILKGQQYSWLASIVTFITLVMCQLKFAVSYLKSREGKSAAEGVFGVG